MTTMRRGKTYNVLSSYCKKKRNWFKGEKWREKNKKYVHKVFQELFLDDIYDIGEICLCVVCAYHTCISKNTPYHTVSYHTRDGASWLYIMYTIYIMVETYEHDGRIETYSCLWSMVVSGINDQEMILNKKKSRWDMSVRISHMSKID